MLGLSHMKVRPFDDKEVKKSLHRAVCRANDTTTISYQGQECPTDFYPPITFFINFLKASHWKKWQRFRNRWPDYADRQISQLRGQFQRCWLPAALCRKPTTSFRMSLCRLTRLVKRLSLNTLRDLKILVKQFSSSIMTSAKSPLFRPSFASQSRINRPWSDYETFTEANLKRPTVVNFFTEVTYDSRIYQWLQISISYKTPW